MLLGSRQPPHVGTGSGNEVSGKLTHRDGKTENMASRLELRKMTEAAEARAADSDSSDVEKGEVKKRKRAVAGAVKKTAVKKKSRSKPVERRRVAWVIFNNTQKEEDRFPYDQRKEAEERLEVLRSKSKRLYWLQAVKEVIGTAPLAVTTPDVYDESFVPDVAEEDEAAVELEEEPEEEEEEEEEEDDEE